MLLDLCFSHAQIQNLPQPLFDKNKILFIFPKSSMLKTKSCGGTHIGFRTLQGTVQWQFIYRLGSILFVVSKKKRSYIVSFNKCTKLKPFIPFSIGLYVKNCNMSSWPSWIFDSCEKKINCEGHLMTIQLGLNHVYCFQQKSFYSSSHRILF
jgi:hypothetical protein